MVAFRLSRLGGISDRHEEFYRAGGGEAVGTPSHTVTPAYCRGPTGRKAMAWRWCATRPLQHPRPVGPRHKAGVTEGVLAAPYPARKEPARHHLFGANTM